MHLRALPPWAPPAHGSFMQIKATYIGVATVLLEVGDLTFLTDPNFGTDQDTVSMGPGARTTRLLSAALRPDELPPLDAILLSHDEHEDNLDQAGRALLDRAGVVLTTRAASRRLRRNSVGLAPFASHEVSRGGTRVRVTATPARHGPLFSLPLVGSVIGFLITWEGQTEGAIYITGDTVFYGGLRQVAARGPIDAAFLHLGGAAFKEGGMKFTMDAADGARAASLLGAKRVFPVHTDGWSHFRDAPSSIAPAFAAAGLGDRLVSWQRGETVRWEAR